MHKAPDIIQISDTMRIRRLNGSNVTVELLGGAEGHEPGWKTANGSGRGPFLQTESAACKWILDRGLLDEDGQHTLEEAVARYEASANKLVAAVDAATGNIAATVDNDGDGQQPDDGDEA